MFSMRSCKASFGDPAVGEFVQIVIVHSKVVVGCFFEGFLPVPVSDHIFRVTLPLTHRCQRNPNHRSNQNGQNPSCVVQPNALSSQPELLTPFLLPPLPPGFP